MSNINNNIDSKINTELATTALLTMLQKVSANVMVSKDNDPLYYAQNTTTAIRLAEEISIMELRNKNILSIVNRTDYDCCEDECMDCDYKSECEDSPYFEK